MDRFLSRKRNEVVESLEKPRKVVRKYNSDYIKYGFISAETDSEPTAHCVKSAQILSNEALRPSKLQRRLDSKHPDVVRKPKKHFETQEKKQNLQKQQGF